MCSRGDDRMPNGNNNTNGISKELEKRIARAKELGVPTLITKLYHDHIKFYPEWIKNPRSRTWIYPAITNAVQLDQHTVKITISGVNFTFSFTEKWISGEHLGLLEVYEDDKKVLALNMVWEYDSRQHEQQIFDIEEFIEGDWIYLFNDFNVFIQKKLKF